MLPPLVATVLLFITGRGRIILSARVVSSFGDRADGGIWWIGWRRSAPEAALCRRSSSLGALKTSVVASSSRGGIRIHLSIRELGTRTAQ